MLTVRRPSSGAPTTTCTATPPRSGRISGASMVKLLDRVAADLVAGAQRELDEPGAGNRMAVPIT
ncbi:hypothetical protein GCM10018954_026240 [Kutzneria kofuensis]